jgi:hypothetical protein
VQEGVTWFKEQQSPVLTRWITVEAPERLTDTEEELLLPVPLFTDIATRLPRRAAYARRSMSQVRYIVISHTAANPNLSLERIAQAHLQHGYPGIAYHFVVTRGGDVFRVSQLEEVAQPDQPWSEQGVNVCLTGNFRNEAPPLPQLDATGRLCAWLAHNLGLAPQQRFHPLQAHLSGLEGVEGEPEQGGGKHQPFHIKDERHQIADAQATALQLGAPQAQQHEQADGGDALDQGEHHTAVAGGPQGRIPVGAVAGGERSLLHRLLSVDLDRVDARKVFLSLGPSLD